MQVTTFSQTTWLEHRSDAEHRDRAIGNVLFAIAADGRRQKPGFDQPANFGFREEDDLQRHPSHQVNRRFNISEVGQVPESDANPRAKSDATAPAKIQSLNIETEVEKILAGIPHVETMYVRGYSPINAVEPPEIELGAERESRLGVGAGAVDPNLARTDKTDVAAKIAGFVPEATTTHYRIGAHLSRDNDQ